ncbi:MAG: glutamine synthetase family protein [Desulfotomaculales bacterium]
MRGIYSKEDVLEKAREYNVQFVRLQFTDVFGSFKNIAVTVDDLPGALEGKVFFDSSVLEGVVENRTRDIYLLPDPATFVIFPWRPREGAVARLICDAVTAAGEPFGACSRQVLKKILKKAREAGFALQVGAGLDFFLFRLDQQGRPVVATHDQAGYCDLTPLDLGENARRDMVLTLKEMGFDVSFSHHEIAPGQHQIFLKEDKALRMADQIATFRFVVRTIAQRHGLHASFMPKPLAGKNGSGMHLHLSLYAGEANVPVGVAGAFIAGLLEHAAALTAVANPLVNSYKRLSSGDLAPALAGWSSGSRNTMIRVPALPEPATEIILRSPDAAANPYLVTALALAAGLDGIARGLNPPPPLDATGLGEIAEEGGRRLPGSLKEALAALDRDELVRSVLGEEILNLYRKIKEAEWERYEAQVHQWEIEEYLVNY